MIKDSPLPSRSIRFSFTSVNIPDLLSPRMYRATSISFSAHPWIVNMPSLYERLDSAASRGITRSMKENTSLLRLPLLSGSNYQLFSEFLYLPG